MPKTSPIKKTIPEHKAALPGEGRDPVVGISIIVKMSQLQRIATVNGWNRFEKDREKQFSKLMAVCQDKWQKVAAKKAAANPWNAGKPSDKKSSIKKVKDEGGSSYAGGAGSSSGTQYGPSVKKMLFEPSSSQKKAKAAHGKANVEEEF